MIDPRNMTLTQWADAVILTVGDAWSFGRLNDEALWRDWAVAFLRATNSSPRNPPDPYQFSDWKQWAMLAYPMLEDRT